MGSWVSLSYKRRQNCGDFTASCCGYSGMVLTTEMHYCMAHYQPMWIHFRNSAQNMMNPPYHHLCIKIVGSKEVCKVNNVTDKDKPFCTYTEDKTVFQQTDKKIWWDFLFGVEPVASPPLVSPYSGRCKRSTKQFHYKDVCRCFQHLPSGGISHFIDKKGPIFWSLWGNTILGQAEHTKADTYIGVVLLGLIMDKGSSHPSFRSMTTIKNIPHEYLSWMD